MFMGREITAHAPVSTDHGFQHRAVSVGIRYRAVTDVYLSLSPFPISSYSYVFLALSKPIFFICCLHLSLITAPYSQCYIHARTYAYVGEA